ncbi:hypothetical protein MUP77_20945, partial [Candidatus Bathyarchaeota archaeon]|nr:hypothetical protein [Candidatus Bathyarchaeota archaeon]
NNQEAMKQISKNCRKKVLKFGWANVAKQYLKTYWLALDKQAVAQHIDQVYGKASKSSLEVTLDYSDEPLVSKDSINIKQF